MLLVFPTKAVSFDLSRLAIFISAVFFSLASLLLAVFIVIKALDSFVHALILLPIIGTQRSKEILAPLELFLDVARINEKKEGEELILVLPNLCDDRTNN